MDVLSTASVLLFVVASSWAQQANHATECQALSSFFTSSQNTSWVSAEHWGRPDYDCCAWVGISCSDVLSNSSVVPESRVVGIALPQNGIVSTTQALTQLFLQLPYLQVVDLGNTNGLQARNSFKGSLPDEWTQCQALTVLSMENVGLSGTLPRSWASMKSLKTISLSYNGLTGSVPREWSAISTLRWVYIGHNQLEGLVPSIQGLCALLLCGNIGITGDLTTSINWTAYSLSTCPMQLYLVGTSVSGSIPCVRNVAVLDVSFSRVSGLVPCCPGPGAFAFIGAEGTAISDWSIVGNPNCVATSLLSLFLSFTNISSIPDHFGLAYPNLKNFTARELMLDQVLPMLPANLTVLDIGGNTFYPSQARSLNGGTTPVISLSSAAAYVDITSMSDSGVTLTDAVIVCSEDGTQTCITKVSAFRALGSALLEQQQSAAAVPQEAIISPMMLLGWDYRIVAHVVLDFVSVAFSGMFQPTLHMSSLLPHVGTPRGTPFEVGELTSRSVAPVWNNSFQTISPTPSGVMVFDGLKSCQFLFGVEYSITLRFVYKPVLLSGPAPRRQGSLTKDLTAGRVVAPPCSPGSLFAVPLTTVCTGCPAGAVCNGSSTLLADGAMWRSQSSYLPFYQCEASGCEASTLQGNNNSSVRLGTECNVGTTGALCSVCTAGYGRDTSGTCTQCSAPGWNWTVVILGAIVVFAFTTFAAVNGVRKKKEPSPSADASAAAAIEVDDDDDQGDDVQQRIVTTRNLLASTAVKKIQNHMGIYAMVGRIALARDPKSVSSTLLAIQQAASQVSLRSISFVNCLFPSLTAVSQFQALLIVTPLLVIIEIVLVRVIKRRWAIASVVSSVLLVLYETSVNVALQLIPTDEFLFYDSGAYMINRDNAPLLERQLVLSLDRRVVVDSTTNGWRSVAYLWLTVFGAGVPLLIILAFVKLEHWYGIEKAKLKLGFLTANFRSKRWYWEEVVMLRKMALAVAVIGLRNFPLAQAQAVIVTLMLYIITLEWQVPFASVWMHHGERVSVYGALIVANIMLARGGISEVGVEELLRQGQPIWLSALMSSIQLISLVVLIFFMWLEWRRALLSLSQSPEAQALGETVTNFTFSRILKDALTADENRKNFSLDNFHQENDNDTELKQSHSHRDPML